MMNSKLYRPQQKSNSIPPSSLEQRLLPLRLAARLFLQELVDGGRPQHHHGRLAVLPHQERHLLAPCRRREEGLTEVRIPEVVGTIITYYDSRNNLCPVPKGGLEAIRAV